MEVKCKHPVGCDTAVLAVKHIDLEEEFPVEEFRIGSEQSLDGTFDDQNRPVVVEARFVALGTFLQHPGSLRACVGYPCFVSLSHPEILDSVDWRYRVDLAAGHLSIDVLRPADEVECIAATHTQTTLAIAFVGPA